MGADHVIPSRWATAIHRDWNRRYVWPRFVTALPREFFAAVRAEADERGIWLVPQTRDMNPVYPGKDVTYIDTKQAQRAAETAVAEGERLATLAWLAGAGYPAESLDKAWRQLVFGAHHDAITGTESDQVYLDLLGGWREAWERGAAARRDAAGYLAGQADTRSPGHHGSRHHGSRRAGRAGRVQHAVLAPVRTGHRGAGVRGARPGLGRPARPGRHRGPALAEGAQRHPDGSLARLTLTFRAGGVPALGYRTYWVAATSGPAPGWETRSPGTVIENDRFRLAADPAQGGTLTGVTDRRTGTELLRAGGNELVLQEEYDQHPRWGEGPWLLSPKGPGTGSASASAKVTAQRCPLGARLLAELALGGLRITQETLLWDGAQQVEFRTHVDGSIGHDRLLRVRFPADVPGGLPVYQTATTAVGRPFGSIGADVAEHAFTLDNPAHEWFGIGSVARVSWPGPGGGQCAIGVAEVILPARLPAPTAWPYLANGAWPSPASCRRWPGRVSPRPARGRTGPATVPSTSTPTCPTCGSRSAARRTTRGRPGCWRPARTRPRPWPASWPAGAMPGCGCPPRSPGPRLSPPAPMSAGRATCRCWSWPARTWPPRSPRSPPTWPTR